MNRDFNWQSENRTRTALQLFPKIDTNKDGFIAKSEIHFWHHSNARNASLRRAELHFNSSDENGDAKYSPPLSPTTFLTFRSHESSRIEAVLCLAMVF